MPVAINPGTHFHSNKPQSPKPDPDPKLYPSIIDEKWDRRFWISLPQPDRVSLVIPITHEVIGAGANMEKAPADWLDHIGMYLAQMPYNTEAFGMEMTQTGKYREISLKVGSREARVRFEFLLSKKYGPRIRIEFNPRKLGPAGCQRLHWVLFGTGKPSDNPPFKFPIFAKNAKLTRLDIAIDVVGIQVSEISAAIKKEGKRSYYVGNDGALETINIHRVVKPPKAKLDQWGWPKKIVHKAKPAGPVMVRIYDRVREREAVLAPPPFGPAPVTRIEIIKDRFHKRYLDQLLELPNPYDDLKVSWMHCGHTAPATLMQRYTMMRRLHSPTQVRDALGLSDAKAAKLEAIYGTPEPQLVGKHSWEGWAKGIASTGLNWLIAPS